MADVGVSMIIDAPPARVWEVVKEIGDHVDWMADARAVRFTSDIRSGMGTTFECDTKVGPFRFTDTMEITEWRDGEIIGVAHTGLVIGSGRFTLLPAGPGRTEFAWREHLEFPFWMGGPLRDPIGSRLLEIIWRRNLRRLKAVVERRPAVANEPT